MTDTLRVQMIQPPREPTEAERLAAEGTTAESEEWASLLESAPAATPSEFRIDSDERADWLLRKVADAKARAERAKAWAAREVEQAEVDGARLMARFGLELEAFARGRLATGKRRSFALPSGVVGFRKSPAHLKVIDDAAALVWAREHAPSAVVPVPATEKLSRSDLALCVPKGEEPPGCEWVDEEDRFYVKDPKKE